MNPDLTVVASDRGVHRVDIHPNNVNLLRFNDGVELREELLSDINPCNHQHEQETQSAILINIAGLIITAVLDTGSAVNVISAELFRTISERTQVPVLPVSNCKIMGAVGTRSKSIKIQAHLEFTIGNVAITSTFLIVESLIVDCILGLEFLLRTNASIDFSHGYCRFSQSGNEYSVQLIRKEVSHGTNFTCRHILYTSKLAKLDLQLSTDDDLSKLKEGINQKVRESVQLTKEQSQDLHKLLNEFIAVFQEKPGTIKGYQCHLNVIEHKTFVNFTYGIPWSKKQAVNNEIQRMLRWKIIEPSHSPYSSPLLPVTKPNGDVRLVLDARQINKIVIPVRTHPENIDELLQKYHGVQYMTSIDLRASYWQIPLDESSKKYTAFIHNGRSYQFTVLPFGLNISSGIFISALDHVLGPQLLSEVSVFVDDLLIATKTWPEHMDLLSRVLSKFKEGGITANLRKSKFALGQVKFLGHLISSYGILPDEEKISAISNFPAPSNKKQLKAFLGLASFYRKYVPNQILIAEPLLHLLRKNTPWYWSGECQAAFQEIKQALVNSKLLYHPDMECDFELSTDASNVGLGSCLFQTRVIDGVPTVCTIAFASRVLSPCERRYTTTELELLSIVWAFKKFHYYLSGAHTKIYCDHKALSFLLNCKLLHPRLTRWSIALQEYSFEIIYVAGKENIVADALSRLPQGLDKSQEARNTTTDLQVLLMTDDANRLHFNNLCTNMSSLQDRDPRWSEVKRKLMANSDPSLTNHYMLQQDVLFYRRSPDHSWCVCIPEEFEEKLIWYTHITWGHFGVIKCAKKIGSYCYFPNIRRKVHKYVRTCVICQKAKPLNQDRKDVLHPILPSKPLELVAVDVCGPFPRARAGAKYLVAFYDVFTKYVRLYPLKIATSAVIIRKLIDDYIPEVGKPSTLLSDNATTFTSLNWKKFLEAAGIKRILIAKYHPEGNPVERIFREVNRFIRTYCHDNHRKWVNFVKPFEEIYNNLPHDSTGFTPTELMLGRKEENEWVDPLPKVDTNPGQRDEQIRLAMLSMTRQANLRKKYFDEKLRRRRSLVIGDTVLIRNHPQSSTLTKKNKKWQLLYSGPFTIISIPHPGAYLLAFPNSLKIKGLYPHQDLKKFVK